MNKSMPSGVRTILISLLLLLAAASLCRADTDISLYPLAGSPLQVRSFEGDGLLAADISGVIEYPFSRLKKVLTTPSAWCEFLPVVFNIKYCVEDSRDNRTLLTLFIGRKFFEPPDEALQLEYVFQVLTQEEDRLQVLLTAEEGPHGTRDYSIEVEAHADSEGGTFLRLNSSFRPSLRSKFATQIYLSTIGSDKVGFSVLTKEDGEPVYVRGKRGIVERNAMRYYLALKAYLDTLELPAENRFDARLNAWFDLTQRYSRQLYEMDKMEYLSIKRKERRYQMDMPRSSNRVHVYRKEQRNDAVRGCSAIPAEEGRGPQEELIQG